MKHCCNSAAESKPTHLSTPSAGSPLTMPSERAGLLSQTAGSSLNISSSPPNHHRGAAVGAIKESRRCVWDEWLEFGLRILEKNWWIDPGSCCLVGWREEVNLDQKMVLFFYRQWANQYPKCMLYVNLTKIKWSVNTHAILKVPKCENFHRTDFFYFYTIKPLWVGDFRARIKNSKF
jgi:hypothetical protein